MAAIEKQTNGTGIPPKIKLYTNHGCPYAHRAHITLKELNLPYEEVIIDLTKPREPWYLEVNPRGLVPSIEYSNGVLENEIITESEIVTRFLCDERPSHLLPQSHADPKAALFRARINFAIDTWNTKISPFVFGTLRAGSEEEKESKVQEWVQAIEKEIEPLLKDASPFFGGSKEMTLFEVQVAPFLLRSYAYSRGGLLPASLPESLSRLPNFSSWAKAVMAKESVTYVFDEKSIVEGTKARMEKMKAQVPVK